MNIFSRIIRGFSSPIDGAKTLMSSKKNLSLAVIPFIIGVAFVVFGFFMASSYFEPMVSQWVESLEMLNEWAFLKGVVSFFILTLSWILVSLLNFISAYICIMIVAGPFYALLVENIFKTEKGDAKQRGTFSLMVTMFFMSLLKVVLFATVGLICFILAFFPIVNLASAFIVVLMVAIDTSDYAFETDYLSLANRLKFVRNNFWEYVGLSCAILLTGFLPGSFFLLLPIFICGATKMYIQLSEKQV